MGDLVQFPIPLRVLPQAGAALATGFSASRQVAELCDQILPELGFAARVAEGQSVTELIAALPPQLHETLQVRFGKAALAELSSLENEGDAELFFSAILNLAGRLAEQESTALTAIGLYHRIETASDLKSQVSLAGQRRQVLEGGGNFGEKAELFFRNMGREMGDYRTLLGAFAGATMASGLYKFTLYKTGRMMSRALHAQGIGPATFEAAMMRMKAKVFGLAAGSLGASLTDRSLRAALGQRVAWDAGSVARETAAASLNLFTWRLASNVSNAYALRALSASPAGRPLVKELEIFAFRQGLGVASLGIAMLANQKIFGGGPENGIAAFSQLASLSAGMNIGGIVGVKVLRLSH